MSITHVTPDAKVKDFKELGKCIIKFSASWCGPCKQIEPLYVALSKKHPDIKFFEVDVDVCDYLSEKFKVQAMPTFVFLREGKEFSKLQGADSEKLRKGVQELAK